MKRFLAIIAFLASVICASAQITEVTAPAYGVQYGRTDISVTAQGNWTNPYRQEEARMDMYVLDPSGKIAVIPAFYAGEGRWTVRFTPKQSGWYNYVLRFTSLGVESTSEPRTLEVTPTRYGSDAHGFLHVNDNWTLRYDDGTLFRGVGENICWESRDEDDSKFFSELHEQADRFNYAAMLPKFAQNGGNFFRVWMCSWNFPIDRKDDFNNSRYSATAEPINESAAAHLDEMVALSEELGLKIMLCMGQGDVTADHGFFTSDEAKAEYRNRLRYIVARWGYSPAIAMWEFFNEIDNIQFRNSENPIPAADIVQWHKEMAEYLKGLDPYGHIVTTSISHRDLEGLNDIAAMDINQKHMYRVTDQIPGTIARYEQAHGKPYIIGEFGYEWDWSKNFDDFADGMNSDFRRGLWQGLFNPTPVTPMSWWWEWFDEHDMVRFFNAPALVNAEMLAAGKGCFEPIGVSTGKTQVEAYAVRCGAKTYVYVYNNSNTAISQIKLVAVGNLRELDIENASWGRYSMFNGTIRTWIRPGQEKVFVIE